MFNTIGNNNISYYYYKIEGAPKKKNQKQIIRIIIYNFLGSSHCLRTYMFSYSDVIVIGHVYYYALYVDPATARTRIYRILWYAHIMYCYKVHIVSTHRMSRLEFVPAKEYRLGKYINSYIFPSKFLNLSYFWSTSDCHVFLKFFFWLIQFGHQSP